MKTELHARIIDIWFQEEYFNRVCNCTIAEMWCATVEANTGLRGQYETMPKCCGGSPAEIVELLKRDGFRVTGPKRIRDLIDDHTLQTAVTK